MFKIKQAQDKLLYAPQMNTCWLRNPRYSPNRYLLYLVHAYLQSNREIHSFMQEKYVWTWQESRLACTRAAVF